jgi:hypothetical protein
MENKPKTHGGSRKGSGRKPKEPTETRRIPVSILPKVDDMILKQRSEWLKLNTDKK